MPEKTIEKPVTLDDVITLATSLSAVDKIRLIERLAARLEHKIPASAVTAKNGSTALLETTPQTAPTVEQTPTPSVSLFGILAHLGPGPSDEDIDEMRREAWANFPREEFYDD